MSPYPTIRVHIESLVVHGLGPLPRATLRDRVAAALRQQLADGALETRHWMPTHRAHADAGAFHAGRDLNVAGIGSGIASAVYREIVPR